MHIYTKELDHLVHRSLLHHCYPTLVDFQRKNQDTRNTFHSNHLCEHVPAIFGQLSFHGRVPILSSLLLCGGLPSYIHHHFLTASLEIHSSQDYLGPQIARLSTWTTSWGILVRLARALQWWNLGHLRVHYEACSYLCLSIVIQENLQFRLGS